MTLDRSPRAAPYAFTEHGVAMLSAVLRSKRAVEVSVLIVRAFVRLRQILASDTALANKVERLERDSAQHGANIEALFDALRALMADPGDDPDRPRIGYETEGNE